MQKKIFGFIAWAMIATIYSTTLSTKADASQHESSEYSTSTQVVATGTPSPANDEPGMRRDYQRRALQHGRGIPVYRDAYSSSPVDSPYTRDAVQPGQRLGRPGHGYNGRGYGYGYPGYRGHGGSGYPRHRQYGNPPPYPSVTAPDEQLVSPR